MAKEAFYFSHDTGARNDPKLQKVLMKLGHAGKSIFWDLVEMLHEEGGYLKLDECENYAFALRTDTDCILSLINDFSLFENDGVKFWSESALRRIAQREIKSKKAAESALSRWKNANASKNDANALRPESEGNAIKERKEKEIKEKKENKSKGDNSGDDCEILINISFSDFWDLYDKKTGNLEKLEKKWSSLTDREREQAMNHIILYKAAQPEKRFRKDPDTYLNNKSFNDEIIKHNGNTEKHYQQSNTGKQLLDSSGGFGKL